MSLGFKMDSTNRREVSVVSESRQVAVLICKRWDGSLLQCCHYSQGTKGKTRHLGRVGKRQLRTVGAKQKLLI